MTILAGGIGSRFWPASTPARPKQLLPLRSDAPLIVDTVHRARALAPRLGKVVVLQNGLVLDRDLGAKGWIRGSAAVSVFAKLTIAIMVEGIRQY